MVGPTPRSGASAAPPDPAKPEPSTPIIESKRTMTDDQNPNGLDPDPDELEVEAEAETEAFAAKRRRGPGRPFEKGQSGNRNGRPVQPSPEIDFRKVLLIELTRLVTIPSTRGKVPAIQAVVRGAILSAVKGNSRSQHEVLEMYRQICREQEVLRDVVQAYSRDTGVKAEIILQRLREMGIEIPGNFNVLGDIASEVARENAFKETMEATRPDKEKAKPVRRRSPGRTGGVGKSD